MTHVMHTFIEDALEVDAVGSRDSAILDDDQLCAGGLMPVRTWVRTKQSTSAMRAKQSREKAEKGEGGAVRKQISLLAPPEEEARAALREAGKRMIIGEISADALRSLGNRSATAHLMVENKATDIGRRALDLIEIGGLRGRLLGHLLGYRRL